MDFIKRAETYIADVQSKKELTCEYVKQAVERHANDLEVAPEKGWYFDKKPANKAMKFVSMLKHTKGRKFAGTPFVLEPWQCFIVYVLFGWFKSVKDEATNEVYHVRRFSTAYVEIAKKNGKTAFAAAIANYLLMMDNEPEAEVYCAATKEKQAKICFNQARAYIEKEPDLKKAVNAKFVSNNVSILSTGSKMEPLGRDSTGLDGVNPSASIIDEYHEWAKDDVRESLESASVSRMQSLMFIITTAGFHKNWPCYLYRKVCTDILTGTKIQDDTFVIIYSLDASDDWKDESVWKKACPNYGISVEPDKMRIQFDKALNRGGHTEVSFKTKNLNLWVDAAETWISDEYFLKCSYYNQDFYTDPAKLEKVYNELKDYPCYAGLDIARAIDINALVLYFPDTPKGVPAYLPFFWIPEEKMIEQDDQVDYRLWNQMPWFCGTNIINTHDGDVIDDLLLVEDILHVLKQFNVKRFGYDPYRSLGGIVQGLLRSDLHDDEFIVGYPQTVPNMSTPTQDFEKEVTSTNVELFGNPCMRWMLGNVVVVIDKNENMMLHKGKAINKIDGIVAAAVARGIYNAAPAESDSFGIIIDEDLNLF